IQNALLAAEPRLLLRAKKTIEQIVRQQLRRQRAVGPRPAQIPLDAFAVRFLANADLQRTKAGLAANLRGDGLIDRWPGAASSRVSRTRDEPAHRLMMAVAGTGDARRRIVQPANDMDVLPVRSERRKARSQRIARSGLGGNPIALGNPVAV